MEPIKPCASYCACPAGTDVYRQDRTCLKIYYVDICGRAQPERYEWDRCGRSRASVGEGLQAAGVEGIGFVVAFPHITKLFRFAPSAETIMHVRAFNTVDFAELDLQREEGYVEFACYAEAVIAGEEYRLWAEASSVEEYLSGWVKWGEAPVRDNEKLARYFGGD